MPRTKTPRPDARSAPDAAPDAAPAPDTAPVPGRPAAAVHAALAANPGATTAAIADAAGTSRPATRDALAALEAAGAATRVRGGKPGVPDTWTLARPPATAEATTGQDGELDQPGDSPAEDAPPAAREEAAEAGPPDGEDPAPERPAQQDGDDAGASAVPAPGPEATEDAQPADDQPGSEAGPSAGGTGQDDDPVDPDATQDEGDNGPGASGDETDDALDPAVVTGLTERLDQVRAAADEAELVLTASGDLRRALAGLDEIYEQAAEARRALKAATSGKKGGPATRPGGLRENVLAHMRANPGTEFTPHQIHNVLGNSSGAIANALDTLVKLGDAELACEKPRRFRLAASAPDTAADDAAPAPAPAPADDDGVGDGAGAGDGTELAGAA
jgi:hypothetical protein